MTHKRTLIFFNFTEKKEKKREKSRYVNRSTTDEGKAEVQKVYPFIGHKLVSEIENLK